MVFSNKKKLKGNKNKIFIAENLTKYRYDLLRQLNGMKKIKNNGNNKSKYNIIIQ
jgi:hypothetical protein